MVSAKFSVVLIAVAVVLCAQLAAASAKTSGRKSSGSTGRSRSSSSGHSNTHHTTHSGGSHSSSNTHSNNQHRGGGDSDRRHSSSDLGSAYSRYDTPSQTSGGPRRGSGSSSSQHGGSDNSHQDSSSSSVPEQRRGRGGHTTDGTSASRDASTHKDHPSHTSHSTATKRPPRFNPRKLSSYQRRKLANKLSRKQRTQRRQKVRQMALDVRRKAKTVEKKTTESKKGLLNALSKKLSAITKKDIDLGLIWAKLKNSTKECAIDSKDSILDFVTDTVGKSVFGECTEAEKYAKLQKDLDTAKETLSGLKNKEKAQLETCSSEDGAESILDRKNNPPKKPVTEAPEPIVTKKESESVLDAAANTTKPENDDDFAFEDSLDNDEDLFRRKRDDSGTVTVGELVDECRETVRNNTLKWTFKLDRDIKSLSEQAKEIDQDKVEDCWSANFGENLGKSGIDFVVSTLGCIATGGP